MSSSKLLGPPAAPKVPDIPSASFSFLLVIVQDDEPNLKLSDNRPERLPLSHALGTGT